MSFDSSHSVNSQSKAKSRCGPNSNSSNRSDSRKSNDKKRKTTQKTLGVTRGANSFSSSRSSSRKAPFSDFGSYMVEKNRKLHNQFDAEASSSYHSGSDPREPIFQGITIFVDGFTVPSSQDLKGYMMKHCGRFENYFSRDRVTHIICSNLANTKIKNLRSFSGGLPVVKPSWVLDSICAKKLLSWVPYELDQIANELRNQPKLPAFFALKSVRVPESTCTVSAYSLEDENKDSESRDDSSNGEISLKLGGMSEFSGHHEGETTEPHKKSIDITETKNPTCGSEEFLQLDTATPRFVNKVNGTTNDEAISSPFHPSDSSSSHQMFKQHSKASTSVPVGRSCHIHSTILDPNFVENYFKSSRLHFIGTWRNRYRKSFPSLSNELKHTNSDGSSQKIIIHVDMDCFFVSVVVRNHPDLWDKPVAVCHSDNPKGTAEVSSANYSARDYGVRAGMFIREAKALCPHLTIVPYNFEAYEEVADQFYNTLHKHCKRVQAVSCDEAFLDVTDSEERNPELLAYVIRKEIFEVTHCTASAGIAGNSLMARIATRSAKPNGQCYIPPEKVDEHLRDLSIRALPGVGHVLEEKLNRIQVKTCSQLRTVSKESLQKYLGAKTGDMLWNYCRGFDNRPVGVIQESKSIGAEVNWGVRFKELKDSHHFLSSLCKEVSLRLQGCGVQGHTFTLKIKKRREDAGEPAKYMGCGDCENLSHSATIPVATDDVEVLQRITMHLFGSFHVDVRDIRGIGLQVTKLENVDFVKRGNSHNDLRSWLLSASSSTKEQHNYHNPIERRPEEINDMYGGKLVDFISKSKGKVGSTDLTCTGSQKEVEGECLGACEAHDCGGLHIQEMHESDQAVSASVAKPTTMLNLAPALQVQLMPLSLSQVDISVLQQMPEELKADIIGQLPAHRKPDCFTNFARVSAETPGLRISNINSGSMELALCNNLWVGSPPYWVDMFKVSNSLTLNALAEMYYRSGSNGLLSSILQCSASESQLFLDEGMDEATKNMCDLLRQYIKLKLAKDIEEIFVCFSLLKRFKRRSKIFELVYDSVFPYLQASVGEVYGGNLHMCSPI